ncbi:HlyC/CorC family transporter [Cryobacterium sp. TMT2-18-3]|uniref:hemolysin family protein n=1 Tax=unclassified Cryobacterium TaxID=2649013 RepID=UPI00106BAC4A|nr:MULTISPECIES: hemolysin family protein [unclassified Cryobacterium]TFC29826.1 HlyC/CorC family transporter [Cryobacterium sp. TMT2-18-2]TFC35781.1 HlyC/CorC family transporter [Cryobacterium sp. TMT2-42-4]TFC61965.1 HlyC/CorC family transporter [Cryobacterium sp. TMT2-18-3]
MYEWIMLAAGLFLTVGTGLFVASEFALVNLDRSELEARRDRGETRLGLTIAALRITSTHLSSAQLGITLTTLLTGYTMEPALTMLLSPSLIGLGLSPAVVPVVAVTTAVIVATLASMIIGELVPKNFALALPVQTAKLVIPFQTLFTTVFKPAVVVLNGSANGVLRSIGIEPKEELSGARTAEELSSLVRRSASAGLLEKDTATLLHRTLLFSGHTASDVMTPRPRVASIERTASAQAVIDLTRQTGYSRFPVVDEGVDDIVGIVHVKQAVAVPRRRRADVPVSALQSEAIRVPETMKLDGLLVELRGRGYQMAIVVDEYGGTAGVATLEDLVEELVGEVADEHDRTRAGVVLSTDSLTFPGMLRPDELLDRTGIVISEDGPYETVGGFVMSELGRLPVVGDVVQLAGGVLSVERLDGRRIDRLRFTPFVEPVEPEEGGEPVEPEEGGKPARGDRGTRTDTKSEKKSDKKGDRKKNGTERRVSDHE